MFRRLLAIALATFLLAGCIKPLVSTLGRPEAAVTAQSAGTLRGSIGTMKGYHVQLTNLLNDFAKGATVSLIEVSSGKTKGTSLADSNGNFIINFGSTFQPAKANPTDTRSIAYYLEAVRGIKGPNPTFNQAGADAMRLRTLIWYDFNAQGWISVANATPGSLTISLSTTSVAFYVNQQTVSNLPVTPEAYIGSIDPSLSSSAPNDYLGPGNGVVAGTGTRNLSAATYGSLFTQVTNAVVKDQDPIQSLVLDSTGNAVNTKTSFTFAGMSPSSGSIGTTVTLTGQGFDPVNMTVSFVGAQATVNQGLSTSTSVVVTVPPGARSGLIQLALNGIYTYTTPFTVVTDDGHRSAFINSSGVTTLYAVSNDFGTLVQVNSDGSTNTLSTALNAPRCVLVNPEGVTTGTYSIYVANAGTNAIVRMDNKGNVLNPSVLSVTDPSGIAIGPDGNLYIAQTSPNQITRVSMNWGTGTVAGPVTTYTGVSGPSAIAFDYKGYLYEVENAQGRVRRFLPQPADTGTIALGFQTAPYNFDDWAYVPDPRGVAVDTAGNCFITSLTNNVVMKADPVRNLTSFTGMNAPRSIARDANGNLYVGDSGRNLIRRITLSGDQRILAYGLAGLRGIAVDAQSNLYLGLSTSGALLKVWSDGATTSTLLSGIEPPSGVTFRNGKLYVAHNDSMITKPCCGGNDGAAVDEVTLTGSARSVLTSGLYWPGSAEVSDDGSTYYVGRDYATYGAWTDSIWWYNTWDSNGLNLINPTAATNVQRRTLMPEFSANNYWNTLAQSTAKLDANRLVYTDMVHRKLVMSTMLNSRAGTQRWFDETPSFSGSNVFPDDIYDAVYDGSQYLYVSCHNGNIYRIDTTTFSSAPGTATATAIPVGSGYPYGLTLLGGNLYATAPSVNRIYRVTGPSTAVAVDASYGTVGNNPAGLTNVGGKLYVSDYNNKQIQQVDPTALTGTVYISGLNGNPSAIAAYSDGRLLVRVSDGVFYIVSTGTPIATSYQSTVGCTGCGLYDFYIDQANSNNILWGQPMSCSQNGNYGLLDTHEIIRDGGWVYMGATNVLYGMNLNAGEDLVINGLGNVMGVAVDSNHTVYAGNTGGTIYAVDGTPGSRAITTGPTLSGSGGIWGLAFDTSASKLYATTTGNSSVYKVDPSTWSQTQLKVGLHAVMF